MIPSIALFVALPHLFAVPHEALSERLHYVPSKRVTSILSDLAAWENAFFSGDSLPGEDLELWAPYLCFSNPRYSLSATSVHAVVLPSTQGIGHLIGCVGTDLYTAELDPSGADPTTWRHATLGRPWNVSAPRVESALTDPLPLPLAFDPGAAWIQALQNESSEIISFNTSRNVSLGVWRPLIDPGNGTLVALALDGLVAVPGLETIFPYQAPGNESEPLYILFDEHYHLLGSASPIPATVDLTRVLAAIPPTGGLPPPWYQSLGTYNGMLFSLHSIRIGNETRLQALLGLPLTGFAQTMGTLSLRGVALCLVGIACGLLAMGAMALWVRLPFVRLARHVRSQLAAMSLGAAPQMRGAGAAPPRGYFREVNQTLEVLQLVGVRQRLIWAVVESIPFPLLVVEPTDSRAAGSPLEDLRGWAVVNANRTFCARFECTQTDLPPLWEFLPQPDDSGLTSPESRLVLHTARGEPVMVIYHAVQLPTGQRFLLFEDVTRLLSEPTDRVRRAKQLSVARQLRVLGHLSRGPYVPTRVEVGLNSAIFRLLGTLEYQRAQIECAPPPPGCLAPAAWRAEALGLLDRMSATCGWVGESIVNNASALRLPIPTAEFADGHRCLAEALDIASRRASEAVVVLTDFGAASCRIRYPANLLRDAFVDLFGDTFFALTAETRLLRCQLATRNVTSPEGETFFVVTMTDDRPGMGAVTFTRLFSAFQEDPAPPEGRHAVGLPLALSTLRDLDGSLAMAHGPWGCRSEVLIPLHVQGGRPPARRLPLLTTRVADTMPPPAMTPPASAAPLPPAPPLPPSPLPAPATPHPEGLAATSASPPTSPSRPTEESTGPTPTSLDSISTSQGPDALPAPLLTTAATPPGSPVPSASHPHCPSAHRHPSGIELFEVQLGSSLPTPTPTNPGDSDEQPTSPRSIRNPLRHSSPRRHHHHHSPDGYTPADAAASPRGPPAPPARRGGCVVTLRTVLTLFSLLCLLLGYAPSGTLSPFVGREVMAALDMEMATAALGVSLAQTTQYLNGTVAANRRASDVFRGGVWESLVPGERGARLLGLPYATWATNVSLVAYSHATGTLAAAALLTDSQYTLCNGTQCWTHDRQASWSLGPPRPVEPAALPAAMSLLPPGQFCALSPCPGDDNDDSCLPRWLLCPCPMRMYDQAGAPLDVLLTAAVSLAAASLYQPNPNVTASYWVHTYLWEANSSAGVLSPLEVDPAPEQTAMQVLMGRVEQAMPLSPGVVYPMGDDGGRHSLAALGLQWAGLELVVGVALSSHQLLQNGIDLALELSLVVSVSLILATSLAMCGIISLFTRPFAALPGQVRRLLKAQLDHLVQKPHPRPSPSPAARPQPAARPGRPHGGGRATEAAIPRSRFVEIQDTYEVVVKLRTESALLRALVEALPFCAAIVRRERIPGTPSLATILRTGGVRAFLGALESATVETLSSRFPAVYGYTRETLPPIRQFLAEPPPASPSLARRRPRHRVTARTASGETRYVVLHLVELEGDLGLVILEDVTALVADQVARAALAQEVANFTQHQAVGLLLAESAREFHRAMADVIATAQNLQALITPHVPTQPLVEACRLAYRAMDTVAKLVMLTRRVSPHPPTAPGGPEPSADAHQALGALAELLQTSIDPPIAVRCRLEARRHIVPCDPDMLERIFLILALNARDAMAAPRSPVPPAGTGGDGIIMLATANATLPTEGDEACGLPPAATGYRTLGGEPPFLVVTVTDSGTGIPAEAQPHLFEPFTTKPEAAGLGLAAVHGALQDLGGWADVATGGWGTRVALWIPLAHPPPQAKPDGVGAAADIASGDQSSRVRFRVFLRPPPEVGLRQPEILFDSDAPPGTLPLDAVTAVPSGTHGPAPTVASGLVGSPSEALSLQPSDLVVVGPPEPPKTPHGFRNTLILLAFHAMPTQHRFALIRRDPSLDRYRLCQAPREQTDHLFLLCPNAYRTKRMSLSLRIADAARWFFWLLLARALMATQQIADSLLEIQNEAWEPLTQSLQEISQNQAAVIQALKVEDARSVYIQQQFAAISETFNKIPFYLQKVKAIRKEMKNVGEKVGKLKKRAEKFKAPS
ncbi:hypothetical protein PAPYR_3601 [Paratrimastix pyriformis]|uniref:Histidine kinase domain-containing protein n=1 Tax=Paratrimastix pyriformis TaxID=342808 RepID=A0ABQ8UM06_9EUKA|nr:hypothetical protein PAPYR_3601 [Paratrimastix pyriformis]